MPKHVKGRKDQCGEPMTVWLPCLSLGWMEAGKAWGMLLGRHRLKDGGVA